jgi:hypothetical protein
MPVVEQWQSLDIVKLYISLISDFFNLSDMTASPKAKALKSHPFLPEFNSKEIQRNLASLKNLLESVKWRN